MSEGGMDPALFAGLRDRDLVREGLAVAEGRLVVERLLRAKGWEPLALRCVPALEADFRTLVGGRCPLLVAEEAETARIVGFPFHRGVIAVARRPPETDPRTLLEGMARQPSLALLLLPATRDPENLGALVRSASALGVAALLLGPETADPYSRRVLRVSMGASLTASWARLRGPEDLEAFVAAGFSIAAAVVDDRGALDVAEWDPGPRTVLALGEEYAGLGPSWLSRAELRVTIGMAEGPDSLNVAAAGAILLHRLARGLVPRLEPN